jgi:uncharacterized protein (DUF885 family)
MNLVEWIELCSDAANKRAVDRRHMLLSCIATSAFVSVGLPRRPHATALIEGANQTPAEELNRLFESFIKAHLDASPEETTSLGLDTGARAWEKSKLDDHALGNIASEKHRIREQLKEMLAFDRASVSGMDRVNYDVVLFTLQATNAANKRYDYGPGAAFQPYVGAGAPYVISPLTGAYSSVPDFLDAQHQIALKADADAYLSRLAAFATVMDQEIEVVRHDVARGCMPPNFTLAKTLQQMTRLRSAAPRDVGLVTSMARRVKEKNIPGDYADQATLIVTEKIYPALDRQIALVKELQAHATDDAGVWKLRKGDQYYADSLTIWTSSTFKPSEIHKLGLDAVAKYSAHINEIMKQHDMTKGTVGVRLRAMFDDPKFHYPNTDAGRDRVLADLNAKVQIVRAKLPQYFGALPKADVVVRRVPQYMETARPSGYYQPPSLDGERPGAYYVNLRNTAETPSFKLPTQTYHSSIPGHHLKGSIYQETQLPLIRKVTLFSAYLEGWSFYAEQLADEMGMYDDDPFGRIGYLHSALRASVALVVDTGLHAMRWPREQAISYFAETLGDLLASATTEVERYCIWPGQVCSYLLDKLAIVRLRDKAKVALGSRFDIRQFHDAILLCGAAPHQVLETVVDAYIKASKARSV